MDTDRERDLAEQQAADLRLRYEAAIAAGHAMVYDWSPATDELTLHGSLSDDLGERDPATDSALEWWLTQVHPDDRQRFRSVVEAQELDANYRFDLEYRVLTRSGAFLWVHDYGRGFVDDSDSTRIVGLVTDITDRKRVELALLESENRFRAFFEPATVGVAEIDSHSGRFLRVNQKYCDILGLTPAEVMRTTFMAVTHPEDLEEDLANMRLLLRGEIRSFSMEKRYVQRDGQEVSVNLTVSAMWGAGQPPSSHIAVVEDITENKRTKEKLRQKDEELRQAHKMEAVGRLAGGIAHDFNNILTVISGLCDQLKLGLAEDDPARDDVEQIANAAERATALTRQLLAFGRQQVLVPQLVSPNEIVGEMEKMLQRVIGEDLRLDCELADEVHPIEADFGQISQILLNLAVNARDAMPRGGELRIRTRNASTSEEEDLQRQTGTAEGERRPWVVVEVGDSGEGIPAERLENIFEPFFTTKEAGGGTGLGLATVYGIVKQSGGHITVRSQLGRGTTFHIFLPACLEEARGDATAAVPDTPEARSEDTAAVAGTVLCVEDERAVRRLVCSALENCGYTVLAAESGERALELVRQQHQPIDIVLTDVVMPGMSGPELVRRLRELEKREVPALVVSGYSGAPPERDPLPSNALFLAKPFHTREMLQCLEELLHSHRR